MGINARGDKSVELIGKPTQGIFFTLQNHEGSATIKLLREWVGS